MFTWVCPTCGKEWDLSVKECAECRGTPAPAPASSRPRSEIRFWLLLGLATVIGVAGLVLWVRYQARRPAREAPTPEASRPSASKGTAVLEPVPQSGEGAGPARDIEVAGLRMLYDSQDRPQVRAVIVNHGNDDLWNVTLAVTLRPAQSAADSPPLARFTLKIAPVLKPGDSREVKAPLETFATLAAMPAWHKLRADIEVR